MKLINLIYQVLLIVAQLEGSKWSFGINTADKEREKDEDSQCQYHSAESGFVFTVCMCKVSDTHLDCENSFMVFLFYDWFTGWEIGPEQVDIADTLICHARYNQSIFNKHLPSDVKWVVPVRDAVSWIKSAVVFYRHKVRTAVSIYHLIIEWTELKSVQQ